MKEFIFEDIQNKVLAGMPKRFSGNLYVEQEVCPVCGNSHNYDMRDSKEVHTNKEEKEMILADLKQLMVQSAKMYMMMRNHDMDTEEWLQIKISEARDRISTAYDYFKFKE